MSNPKYVSIDYNEYHNKYKPAADDNVRLRDEVDRLKAALDQKGRVVVFIRYYKRDGWHGEDPLYIEVDTPFVGEVAAEIKRQCEVAVNDIAGRYRDQVIGICESTNRRIDRIPRFIKWIFRIKKV